MSHRCLTFEASLERMLADTIEPEERDRLLLHAESCAECREFVEVHYRLLETEHDLEMPSDEELQIVRKQVLRQIDAPASAKRRPAVSVWSWLSRPAWTAMGMAAVAAMAFGIGWFGAPSAPGFNEQPLLLDPDGISRLNQQARNNRRVEDVAGSPFVFSNVDVAEMPDGTVALQFDVTRYVETRRERDDPLVKEVLVQSLLHQAPVGTRLRAVDVAGESLDDKVREALVWTVLNDDNQAVRAKALSTLSVEREHPLVRDTLLAMLRDERAPQLRLIALEALAGSDASQLPGDVDTLPGDDPVLLHRVIGEEPEVLR